MHWYNQLFRDWQPNVYPITLWYVLRICCRHCVWLSCCIGKPVEITTFTQQFETTTRYCAEIRLLDKVGELSTRPLSKDKTFFAAAKGTYYPSRSWLYIWKALPNVSWTWRDNCSRKPSWQCDFRLNPPWFFSTLSSILPMHSHLLRLLTLMSFFSQIPSL